MVWLPEQALAETFREVQSAGCISESRLEVPVTWQVYVACLMWQALEEDSDPSCHGHRQGIRDPSKRREPRALQVTAGCPVARRAMCKTFAKSGMLSNFEPGMAVQHLGPSRPSRASIHYLMVSYAPYAVFRTGCEVVVSGIRNRLPAMISTVAPSGKALKRRDAAQIAASQSLRGHSCA